jgi:hypothetical protein
MAVFLLLGVCAWAIVRALTKRARLSEMALTLLAICAAAFVLEFDDEVYLSGQAVLVTILFLAVLIILRFRGADEGRWLGLSALLATGFLFYFGFVSNVLQGWRGDVPDVNAPIWNGRYYVVQGGDTLLLNGRSLTCWAGISPA